MYKKTIESINTFLVETKLSKGLLKVEGIINPYNPTKLNLQISKLNTGSLNIEIDDLNDLEFLIKELKNKVNG